jgi:hypothetical protein
MQGIIIKKDAHIYASLILNCSWEKKYSWLSSAVSHSHPSKRWLKWIIFPFCWSTSENIYLGGWGRDFADECCGYSRGYRTIEKQICMKEDLF